MQDSEPTAVNLRTPITALYTYFGAGLTPDDDAVRALLQPFRNMQGLVNTVQLWEESFAAKACNLHAQLGCAMSDAASIMAYLQDHRLLHT